MTNIPPSPVSYEKQGRRRSYWEPFYDPNAPKDQPNRNWDFSQSTGASRSHLKSDDVPPQPAGSLYVLKNNSFESCDFSGEFSARRIVFDRCSFTACDFGTSVWVSAKFSNCTFAQSSFSQASFKDCSFFDCEWVDIGISDTGTRLDNTQIDDVREFLAAAFFPSDRKLLSDNGTSLRYQKMRRESARAALARSLLDTHKRVGGESNYYRSVGVSTVYGLAAEAAKARHLAVITHRYQKFSSCVRWMRLELELVVVRVAGSINDWGESAVKPFLLGLAITLAFAAFYLVLGVSTDLATAMVMSLDVTLLIGYTKQANGHQSLATQFAFLANAAFGLIWYTIIVPTVVNKVSKVR